jgi:putative membrane protein (TIGR04086 family)
MGHFLIRPILTGVIAIVAILIVFSFILSLMLHFTMIQEASIQLFLLPITLLTLFIGGVIAGYQSGGKGWYFGGVTGLAFLLIAWLVSFLGFDILLSLKNLLTYLSYLLLAMMGGMVGVNMSPNRYN